RLNKKMHKKNGLNLAFKPFFNVLYGQNGYPCGSKISDVLKTTFDRTVLRCATNRFGSTKTKAARFYIDSMQK
ncbi:MAG: hypothetical protein RSE54_12100, partial [Ruthenibacterium sp.]